MKTKETFIQRVKFNVGNGNGTRFREDTWLGGMPLALHYPTLYNIVQRKEAYAATVLQSVPPNIQFGRALVGERWLSWLHLLRRLMDVQLSHQPDTIH